MGFQPFGKKLPVNEIHIKFLVPSTKKKSIPISNNEFLNRINISKSKINSMFQGSTRWTGTGSFRFRGKDIEEKVGIIECFTNINRWKQHRSNFRSWMGKLKRKWGQISLAFEFEEDLYFI